MGRVFYGICSIRELPVAAKYSLDVLHMYRYVPSRFSHIPAVLFLVPEVNDTDAHYAVLRLTVWIFNIPVPVYALVYLPVCRLQDTLTVTNLTPTRICAGV
jgi:hypothetical protein